MLINYLSDMIIKGGAAPLFDDPAEFGLSPEEVSFPSSDGVTLRGWLFRGSGPGIIVQSHFGVQCSRCGYTPKGKGWMPLWKEDIRFLKHIRALVDAGYSVLAYDTRNHGGSDAANDGWVSWGPVERQDVLGAVRYIADHPDFRDQDIGLLSFCMGLASTTYAYGEPNGLADIPAIKALVGVQPLLYPDFMKAMGLPGFLSRRVSARNAERTGVDLVDSSFLPATPKISVPVLLVQNSNDPFPDMANVDAFYSALTVRKERLNLDLDAKRAAAYAWVTENPGFLLEFFGKHLNQD